MKISLSSGPRRRAVRLGLGLALTLPFAGCADVTDSVDSAAELAPDVRAAEASLQVVGRAVAVALGDESVRLGVRDALRDSRWDVHQVVLQEYLASEAASGLLTAAAQAAGESPTQFQARLAALPPLDLYVPARNQRMEWTGTADVVVAVTANAESGRVFGFTPAGGAVSGALAGGASGATVFLIAPSEGRVERADRQQTGTGEVIQSADDGEDAEEVWWVEPNGTRTRIRVGGEVPGVVLADPVPGSDTTYLDFVKIYYGDAGNDAELNVDASFYGPDGALIGTAEYDNYSFPEEGERSPHWPFFRHVVPDSGVAKVRIHVWEDDCDCFGNDDDHYGTRDFTWNDRGQVRTLADSEGDTDIELDWLPRSKSVLTSVLLSGASMYVGQGGYSSAQARDQYGYVLSGFSVSSWSIANTSVATISSSNGSEADLYGEEAGSTTLSATISGVTGYGSVSVEELPPPCPPPLLACE